MKLATFCLFICLTAAAATNAAERTFTRNLQVCPFHHGKKYREAGNGGGRGEASLYHARLLCQLWRKVEVAASEAAADQEEDNMLEATSVMPDKVPKENYRIPTPKELQELMHVDDAVDELRDKEKMNYIEAQEKALKKMHIEHNLRKEELMNTLRDFQDEGGPIAVQNNEATQQFPSYVMPEAAKGVPISEALPDTGSLSWRNSILSKLKDPIIIDPKQWY